MSSSPQRWATFDCYGTLVDWNAGIGAQLARLFGDAQAAGLLHRYHAVEPRIQSERPGASYREVMALTLAELASEAGTELKASERDALGRSLGGWPVFAEVPAALAEAHQRGWKLVALPPTRELPTLTRLADVLEELVPGRRRQTRTLESTTSALNVSRSARADGRSRADLVPSARSLTRAFGSARRGSGTGARSGC